MAAGSAHVGSLYVVLVAFCFTLASSRQLKVYPEAGNLGTSGYADSLDLSLVQFNSPLSIFFDIPRNRAIVSDSGNHALRVIWYSNTTNSPIRIETLAGAPPPAAEEGYVDGDASSARMTRPTGVAVDNDGNVIFMSSYAVRLVQASDHSVRTLTGSMDQSQLDGCPPDVYLDTGGQIVMELSGTTFVFADAGSHAVRRMDIDACVSTIGGWLGAIGYQDTELYFPTGLLNGPYGLAMDASGAFVVGDSDNHAIRILNTSGLWKYAGSCGYAPESGFTDGERCAARFSFPSGLALQGQVVYVADRGNHAIRRIDRVDGGVVTTIAGAAPPTPVSGVRAGSIANARFNQPFAVALDGFGNLLIADSGNHAIKRLSFATETVSVLPSATATIPATPSATSSASRTIPGTPSATTSETKTSAITKSATNTASDTHSESTSHAVTGTRTLLSTETATPLITQTHSTSLSSTLSIAGTVTGSSPRSTTRSIGITETVTNTVSGSRSRTGRPGYCGGLSQRLCLTNPQCAITQEGLCAARNCTEETKELSCRAHGCTWDEAGMKCRFALCRNMSEVPCRESVNCRWNSSAGLCEPDFVQCEQLREITTCAVAGCIWSSEVVATPCMRPVLAGALCPLQSSQEACRAQGCLWLEELSECKSWNTPCEEIPADWCSMLPGCVLSTTQKNCSRVNSSTGTGASHPVLVLPGENFQVTVFVPGHGFQRLGCVFWVIQ